MQENMQNLVKYAANICSICGIFFRIFLAYATLNDGES